MPANPRTGEGGSFAGRRSAADHRRAVAETYYELELMAVEDGWARGPWIYDSKRGFFRYPDGTFAFSKAHVNERALIDRGDWSGPTSWEAARLARGGRWAAG